jgi:hypothetical protein
VVRVTTVERFLAAGETAISLLTRIPEGFA